MRNTVEQGFTLVELMLVLAIIGIISAIAIPALLGQRESARNRATLANAGNVAGMLQNALDMVEQPQAERTAVDLATATTITETLTIVANRPEFKGMRNPFAPASPAYQFFKKAAVAGEVGLVPTLAQGQYVVEISYGLQLKGTLQLKVLPKCPESTLPLS